MVTNTEQIENCLNCRQLKELEQQRAKLTESLLAAEKASEEAKGAAAERQKRFNLLNLQFRKREAEMQSKIADAQGEAEISKRHASDAQVKVSDAAKV